MAIPFSDEDLRPAVLNSLNKVQPTLALDGGGIELIDIINGVVFVKFQGACVGCSSINMTLKHTIEKQLKIDIHPEMIVKNVPAGMENLLHEL